MQAVTKLNWTSQAVSVQAIAIGKVSVAILIGRIMGPSRWRKYFLYFLSVTSLILACLCTILIFVQCSPSNALWEGHFSDCWDLRASDNFFIAVSSRQNSLDLIHTVLMSIAGYYIAVNLSLALLPTTFIWRLNMARKKKAAISILLGFGVL